MSENKKMASLEEMMLESFQNRPNQAIEAIEEYLENLGETSSSKYSSLKEKLKSSDYFKNFQEAITQTSLILFLISIKASNDVNKNNSNVLNNLTELDEALGNISIDMDRYIREYLMFARKDDLDIYEMRMFYLDSLTGEEWVGQEFDPQESSSTESGILREKIDTYNNILNAFKQQYKESKIHIVQ